jgi:predicted metal-binding membrane protein
VTAALLRRSGRVELRLAAVVLTLAAAAWVLTAHRMAGMDAGPGTDLGGVGWFAISWLVMMPAMMLPALTPMAVAHGRRATGAGGASAAFGAGYLSVWLAAGLAGYAAIEAVRSLGLGFLAWDAAGRYVAAGVVVAAGLYQLTAAKEACLRRCRDRRTFLRTHWHPGGLGALRMGAEHGGACLGCSWALMAALFALGVMSLTWMAVSAVLVAAERLLPRPARLGVALVLVALGTAVALAPGQVPALTIPSSQSVGMMPMHRQS